MAAIDDILLPRGWTKTVRSSVLHAISIAFTALTHGWAAAATGRRRAPRLQSEFDRVNTEIALLTEELAIKNDRMRRVQPRRRPHYCANDRMRMLQLKAARGWSLAQTAEVFAVTEDTIASWLERADEEGERPLVQTAEPVNKFPAYVGYLVRQLKALCPAMGKLRIAQVLARAGLQLGATTVGRFLRQRPDPTEEAEATLAVQESAGTTNTLRAKRPNHIWHVDLSTIPTAAGFWVPWIPLSKLQRWPFCWWVAVVIDQFSRRVIGFALFRKAPTSTEVCRFLDRATKRADARPRHIVADKGKQFFCATFRTWSRRRGVQPRFGAVGEHGSIAIVERYIRSMKAECTRRILAPFEMAAIRSELASYATWYNGHRPHQALDGRTPVETYRGSATSSVTFEPRQRWPIADDQVERAGNLQLLVKFLDSRRHLPVVELRQAG
jgi:transposase InsO family protein